MATLKEKITALPTTPGVYLYTDAAKTVIYVGKAVNLRRRVKQYFEKDSSVSLKTRQLVSHIRDICFMKTITEFDALLLEANLIQKYQPKYNSIAKDDKSPIYIRMPIKEEMPRISLVRKPKKTVAEKVFYAGPFQSTRIAGGILRSIRRFIPFCTQKTRNGKPCFYTHIGLCAPCPSEITRMENPAQKRNAMRQYRKNMFRIRRILQGNVLPIVGELEREMKEAARGQQFERAALLRNRINSMRQVLNTHFDPSLYLSDAVAIGETVEGEREDIETLVSYGYPDASAIHKIECIDISNTAGIEPVGSLVVVVDGMIDRSQYRKFKITGIAGQNDTAMIRQVVERRLRHAEWPFPDLLVIDGGKGQVQAAETAVKTMNIPIPVIGLAKRYESVIMRINGMLQVLHLSGTRPAVKLLKRIRDESHRFALTFHRAKREKAFLEDVGHIH